MTCQRKREEESCSLMSPSLTELTASNSSYLIELATVREWHVSLCCKRMWPHKGYIYIPKDRNDGQQSCHDGCREFNRYIGNHESEWLRIFHWPLAMSAFFFLFVFSRRNSKLRAVV